MALKPISLDSVNRFIALVIGDSGVGKTSLLRTIPEDEPVFVVSAESGLLCVKDLVVSRRVQGVEVSSFSDLSEVYGFLNSPRALGYKWLFIDSLTEIAARCVDAVKIKYPNRSDSFPMWGEYTEKITQHIKAYRDLTAFNVVFTCLEEADKDEVNRRIFGPVIAGKEIKKMLRSWFDEVFFMTLLKDASGVEQRVFITQPWENRPAKDRSGKLALVESPHLGEIKRKILGGN
jgi:predicted ATPase